MRSTVATSLATLLAGCSVPGLDGQSEADWRFASTLRQEPRLSLDGGHSSVLALPIDPRTMPAPVRTVVAAVLPEGELEFCAREQGRRGAGFRVEKRYRNDGHDERRSLLVDAGGAVLERWHTVPIGEVPQHVLAAILRPGLVVEEAAIVSGPVEEEHWLLLAHDRTGPTFVAEVSPTGRLQRSRQRLTARIERDSTAP